MLPTNYQNDANASPASSVCRYGAILPAHYSHVWRLEYGHDDDFIASFDKMSAKAPIGVMSAKDAFS